MSDEPTPQKTATVPAGRCEVCNMIRKVEVKDGKYMRRCACTAVQEATEADRGRG